MCRRSGGPLRRPGNRPGLAWPAIAGAARRCAPPRRAVQSRGAMAWPAAPCRRRRSPVCPGRGSSRLHQCAGVAARPYAPIRRRFARRAGRCGEEHPIHQEARRAAARCHSAPLQCGAVRHTRKPARIWHHRCTQMHADGPESGRFVHSRNPTTEPGQPCRCDGHCPIRVHLRASAVPNFLLASGWPVACQDPMHQFAPPARRPPDDAASSHAARNETLMRQGAQFPPQPYSHATKQYLFHGETRRPRDVVASGDSDDWPAGDIEIWSSRGTVP
jgi:hypothetical protein